MFFASFTAMMHTLVITKQMEMYGNSGYGLLQYHHLRCHLGVDFVSLSEEPNLCKLSSSCPKRSLKEKNTTTTTLTTKYSSAQNLVCPQLW